MDSFWRVLDVGQRPNVIYVLKRWYWWLDVEWLVEAKVEIRRPAGKEARGLVRAMVVVAWTTMKGVWVVTTGHNGIPWGWSWACLLMHWL